MLGTELLVLLGSAGRRGVRCEGTCLRRGWRFPWTGSERCGGSGQGASPPACVCEGSVAVLWPERGAGEQSGQEPSSVGPGQCFSPVHRLGSGRLLPVSCGPLSQGEVRTAQLR